MLEAAEQGRVNWAVVQGDHQNLVTWADGGGGDGFGMYFGGKAARTPGQIGCG